MTEDVMGRNCEMGDYCAAASTAGNDGKGKRSNSTYTNVHAAHFLCGWTLIHPLGSIIKYQNIDEFTESH